MTIRWGTGLFRTWLLATVLWVGFAGWAEMRSISSVPINPFDLIDPPGKSDQPPPFALTQPMPDFDPNVPATPIGRPDNPASKLGMVSTIFAPPLFVLIFGCALPVSILTNPKYEAAAQALAAGKTQQQAYTVAGFTYKPANASRFFKRADVRARVQEIVTERIAVERKSSELAVKKAGLTKEWVIQRLMWLAERSLRGKPVID